MALAFVSGWFVTSARASWEYMELAANGFMIFDAGKFAKQAAMAMMQGTVGDAGTFLGLTHNTLTMDKNRLQLSEQEVMNMGALYANLGARQSAASTGSGTALLDTAIEFGDLNDRILSNALEQAEKEGMDPRAMQSLAQTVHGTARIQVFDEVLRMYEKMGGARLSIAERANLKAQIDLLNDDQLNHETIVRLAKAQREVYESQQKADAAELGRRVVHNAARQGLRLDGEYADYAPTVDTVNVDPEVYKYDEIGGMVSIVDPSRPAIASANPFVGNPFIGAKGSDVGTTPFMGTSRYIPGSTVPSLLTPGGTTGTIQSAMGGDFTPEMTAYAAQMAQQYGLTSLTPADSQKWFPGVVGPPSAMDWANLMGRMSKLESGVNPELTYKENFTDSSGNNVISTGLLQLSQESARGYGFDVTTNSLKDPAMNIEIGAAILAKWVKTDGVISGGSSGNWKGAARYWSIYRSGKMEGTASLTSHGDKMICRTKHENHEKTIPVVDICLMPVVPDVRRISVG